MIHTKPTQEVQLFGQFVLASLLLHGLVLGLQSDASTLPLLGSVEPGTNTLEVRISAIQPEPDTIPKRPPTQPELVPLRQPETEPLSTSIEKTAAEKEGIEFAEEADITPPPKQPPSAIHNTQLRQKIQTAFDSHFFYPQLAVRKGWSGEVVLQIAINHSNGQLEEIQLKKSSGFKLLDQSAIRTMEKLKNTPILEPSTMHGLIWMELPVVYRLQG